MVVGTSDLSHTLLPQLSKKAMVIGAAEDDEAA
jgi:hypothetical protein